MIKYKYFLKANVIWFCEYFTMTSICTINSFHTTTFLLPEGQKDQVGHLGQFAGQVTGQQSRWQVLNLSGVWTSPSQVLSGGILWRIFSHSLRKDIILFVHLKLFRDEYLSVTNKKYYFSSLMDWNLFSFHHNEI